jgi:hypothetical protein
MYFFVESHEILIVLIISYKVLYACFGILLKHSPGRNVQVLLTNIEYFLKADHLFKFSVG